MRGKTIQVFLTDGSPRGIKLAEITSNIELAVFIPRVQMNDAGKRAELSLPGVYFLFGENEAGGKPMVYIGQSRNCLDRIKQHDQKKDFWNYAVLIVSKTNNFTQTHIEYLEQLAIDKAIEAKRYVLENGNSPKKFSVPEMLEADLLDSFDTIKILLSTLGFPLFEGWVEYKEQSSSQRLFCKAKAAKAEAEYVNDGLLVFKGSTANLEFAPTSSSSLKLQRDKLIESKVLQLEGSVYVFTEDYLFTSPSAAASQIQARNANGWIEWKDAQGKTLDELYRK
ncbi:GIY-YIG nuclease family protein [Flavobacterium filum]|uniref:GIY-YIG nuclease family protein n=1 Tax=Flavobacterium filum TaxID=370974 RepID=UPI0023F43325|nr:GIY-YIG nuclease family protein [Flavobacterium filum]